MVLFGGGRGALGERPVRMRAFRGVGAWEACGEDAHDKAALVLVPSPAAPGRSPSRLAEGDVFVFSGTIKPGKPHVL